MGIKLRSSDLVTGTFSHRVILMALMFSMCNGIYGLLKLCVGTTESKDYVLLPFVLMGSYDGLSASLPKRKRNSSQSVLAWNASLSPQRKKRVLCLPSSLCSLLIAGTSSRLKRKKN